MRSTLEAIRAHPQLDLQLVATGMHLARAHGRSIDAIRREGWKIDATVPWPSGGKASPAQNAARTGAAMAGLARAFEKLRSDLVLVVGDRVEAFAAAAAGHVAGLVVAHVHGGDRALGQVDDALRHAITKLAHVHFPATTASAERIAKLGEESWRIHRVGSPGIDGIRQTAAARAALRSEFPDLRPRRYALLVLHPTTTDESAERRHAEILFRATESVAFERVVIVYPNNDPGSGGILSVWDDLARQDDDRFILRRDVPRAVFLGLLRDAAVLVGNSSSGIIEAASFGTMVVDVGRRQAGRERGDNVRNVPFQHDVIRRALEQVWNEGRVFRFSGRNVYGGAGTGQKIAHTLARLRVTDRLTRKLIRY